MYTSRPLQVAAAYADARLPLNAIVERMLDDGVDFSDDPVWTSRPPGVPLPVKGFLEKEAHISANAFSFRKRTHSASLSRFAVFFKAAKQQK